MAGHKNHVARKVRGGSLDKPWEDDIRKKIQTSQVINRLIGFVNGDLKLDAAQVTAALGLTRKVLPDLTYSETKSDVTYHYAEVPKTADDEEWQRILDARSGVPSQDRKPS